MKKYETDKLISIIKKEKSHKKVNTLNKENISCMDSRHVADDKILQKFIKNDDTVNKFRNKNYMYHISTLLNSFCSTRMGADRLFATAIKFSDHGKFIEAILNKQKPMNDTELNRIKETLCQKLKLRKTEEKEESREFRSYSFATKFLAFHSEYLSECKVSLFPIYDGQVKSVIVKYGLNKIATLKNFIEELGFTEKEEWLAFSNYCHENNIKTICLEEYPQFYKLMNIISLTTGLNLTQLDRLFWRLGDKIQREEAKTQKVQ